MKAISGTMQYKKRASDPLTSGAEARCMLSTKSLAKQELVINLPTVVELKVEAFWSRP